MVNNSSLITLRQLNCLMSLKESFCSRNLLKGKVSIPFFRNFFEILSYGLGLRINAGPGFFVSSALRSFILPSKTHLTPYIYFYYLKALGNSHCVFSCTTIGAQSFYSSIWCLWACGLYATGTYSFAKLSAGSCYRLPTFLSFLYSFLVRSSVLQLTTLNLTYDRYMFIRGSSARLSFFFNHMLNFHLGLFLKLSMPGFVDGVTLSSYELRVFYNAKRVVDVIFFLKNNSMLLYSVLTDLIVLDFPAKLERFKVVYYLLSLQYVSRVSSICDNSEYIPMLSITECFKSASWLEREAWDMFGVYFINHPDLRRILTDYGFQGFPLRKDFPLVGFVEVFFDDSKNRIVYLPISLSQELRGFQFKNPWAKASLAY